jgi:hypothetical protein
MPIPKLYLPYGTLRVPGGPSATHDISLHWFCKERPTPVTNFAELIMGHKGLSEETRLNAEAAVSEFFTEDEFHQLRAYLRDTHRQDLRTAVLVPPVNALHPDHGTRVGAERPFARQAVEEAGGRKGFVKLSETEGCNLPFTVWGYYSLPHAVPLSIVQRFSPFGLSTAPVVPASV